MTHISPSGVEILGHLEPGYREILDHDALSFLAGLHRRFDRRRQSLLRKRKERAAELDAGAFMIFPHETADIRASEWTVRPAPADLQDRRVEITGPVDRKMVVNALNSGAKCFMADFEDATAPLWDNLVQGQINLRDAIRREIDFTDEKSGKQYKIGDDAAVHVGLPNAEVQARSAEGLHRQQLHEQHQNAGVLGHADGERLEARGHRPAVAEKPRLQRQ